MKNFLTPLAGASLAAGAMAAWIAYINRPVVERFTILYEGQELSAQGKLGFGQLRDTNKDTV